jgi:hypothetical protein
VASAALSADPSSVDLFDTYGVQVLAGRNFMAGDVGPANVVVVNRSFAEMYPLDGNARREPASRPSTILRRPAIWIR